MAGTIVMIHGMMGGAWCWDNYKEFFEARGYRCLVPVLRYHDMDPAGKPDPRLGGTSLLDYARDLEGEIRQLDEPPVLLGHSMGGLLAQMLASRGLARALVLLSPAAPAGILSANWSAVKDFLVILRHLSYWRGSFRLADPAAVYAFLDRLPEAEQEKACRRLVYESGRAALEIGCWLLDPRRAARVDAEQIKCPVLVLAGKADKITPASVVKQVAGRYKPLVTYQEFDHTHWIIGEPGWEAVAGYIDQWLVEQDL